MAARCEGQTAIRGSAVAGRAPSDADRSEDAELGELVLERDRAGDGRLRVVGHAITACSSRNSSAPPAAFITRASWQVGGAIEGTCAWGPRCASTSRCRGARTAGSRTGRVRPGRRRRNRSAGRARPACRAGAAAGAARGEEVGVEQLARAHDRVAQEGRGDARQRGVALGLVPVAAAVHQIGRAGGAHVGVVERLEHGRRLGDRCAPFIL